MVQPSRTPSQGKQEIITGNARGTAGKILRKKRAVTHRYVFSAAGTLFGPLQIRAQ
ncbi:hypothetical protein BN126_4076 [Cronobacter sakazakii 680]|nr:hypothetical protein BN126_4076 [Cronobacter sakazakii 680]